MKADPQTSKPLDGRRESRSAAPVSVNARVSLRIAGAGELPVDLLRNVSAGGANLVIGQALVPGSQASVLLSMAGLRLEFLATVAWCRPEAGEPDPPTRYAVGLQLRGPGSFAAMLSAS